MSKDIINHANIEARTPPISRISVKTDAGENHIKVSNSTRAKLKVYTTPASHIKLNTDAGETHIKVSNGSADVPVYKGAYLVVPRKTQDVVLETRHKKMLDDVTVEKIHYAETSNEAGGKTAVIGFD